jgi:hypothetical protein
MVLANVKVVNDGLLRIIILTRGERGAEGNRRFVHSPASRPLIRESQTTRKGGTESTGSSFHEDGRAAEGAQLRQPGLFVECERQGIFSKKGR